MAKVITIHVINYLAAFAKHRYLTKQKYLCFEHLTFVSKHKNTKYYKQKTKPKGEKIVPLQCVVYIAKDYVEKAIVTALRKEFDTVFFTYISLYLTLKPQAQIKEAIYDFMSTYNLHDTAEFDTLKKKFYRHRLTNSPFQQALN